MIPGSRQQILKLISTPLGRNILRDIVNFSDQRGNQLRSLLDHQAFITEDDEEPDNDFTRLSEISYELNKKLPANLKWLFNALNRDQIELIFDEQARESYLTTYFAGISSPAEQKNLSAKNHFYDYLDRRLRNLKTSTQYKSLSPDQLNTRLKQQLVAEFDQLKTFFLDTAFDIEDASLLTQLNTQLAECEVATNLISDTDLGRFLFACLEDSTPVNAWLQSSESRESKLIADFQLVMQQIFDAELIRDFHRAIIDSLGGAYGQSEGGQTASSRPVKFKPDVIHKFLFKHPEIVKVITQYAAPLQPIATKWTADASRKLCHHLFSPQESQLEEFKTDDREVKQSESAQNSSWLTVLFSKPETIKQWFNFLATETKVDSSCVTRFQTSARDFNSQYQLAWRSLMRVKVGASTAAYIDATTPIEKLIRDLRSQGLLPVREVRFKSADGTQLTSKMSLPADFVDFVKNCESYPDFKTAYYQELRAHFVTLGESAAQWFDQSYENVRLYFQQRNRVEQNADASSLLESVIVPGLQQFFNGSEGETRLVEFQQAIKDMTLGDLQPLLKFFSNYVGIEFYFSSNLFLLDVIQTNWLKTQDAFSKHLSEPAEITLAVTAESSQLDLGGESDSEDAQDDEQLDLASRSESKYSVASKASSVRSQLTSTASSAISDEDYGDLAIQDDELSAAAGQSAIGSGQPTAEVSALPTKSTAEAKIESTAASDFINLHLGADSPQALRKLDLEDGTQLCIPQMSASGDYNILQHYKKPAKEGGTRKSTVTFCRTDEEPRKVIFRTLPEGEYLEAAQQYRAATTAYHRQSQMIDKDQRALRREIANGAKSVTKITPVAPPATIELAVQQEKQNIENLEAILNTARTRCLKSTNYSAALTLISCGASSSLSDTYAKFKAIEKYMENGKLKEKYKIIIHTSGLKFFINNVLLKDNALLAQRYAGVWGLSDVHEDLIDLRDQDMEKDLGCFAWLKLKLGGG